MRPINADALIEAIKDYPYGLRGMIAHDIAEQPTVEPTEEMIQEYCRKRCLCIVTADLFERWKHSVPMTIEPNCGAQMERSEDERTD